MSRNQPLRELIAALETALRDGSFVRLSLGNYGGQEPDLKGIHLRRILIKREEKLSFTYRYKTRDIVKNHGLPEALAMVTKGLENDFRAATLFTTAFDLHWDGKTLRQSSATSQAVPSPEHDRSKARLIGPDRPYLHALGITDAKGAVLPSAQDKYRQINKYVEILSGLVKSLPPEKILRIADMGSGKGYLTFALYDYLHNTLDLQTKLTGVEYRADLVKLCNTIAGDSGFNMLDFTEGAIAGYDATGINILIALHACDTATDDAIAKGIRAGAELIVVAPCCHKQIRKEMERNKTPNDLAFLLKHGIFLERQAEMVTDGLRALVLEYFGYQTKVFEFISDAHTPKNVMIVGTKNAKAKLRDPAILKRIAAAKAYFGIEKHHLETVTEI